MSDSLLILDGKGIRQRLRRMAYQIYEQHYGEREVLICGIQERGYLLAARIAAELKEISDFDLSLSKVVLDKNNPRPEEIYLDPVVPNLSQKTVILCDDVLYTGRTLAYAAMPMLQAKVKTLQCLVLIHRNHLTFPIQPTYIGLPLATTLQEHVVVDFKGETVRLK